jgi:hypothetical protein
VLNCALVLEPAEHALEALRLLFGSLLDFIARLAA